MSAGYNADLTKRIIDQAAGKVAQDVNAAMTEIQAFKDYLDGQVDADLTALGYSAGDVANLRSALADLSQLRTIYLGTAALAAVKDFRVFARRIWGTGYTGQ